LLSSSLGNNYTNKSDTLDMLVTR